MIFKLSPNASRRTKQRFRAHVAGRCNTSKCRWHRVTASKNTAPKPQKVEVTMKSEPEPKILPTAFGVLEDRVADNYDRAAKKVARSKAEIEISNETYIPGLKVWHRYKYRSAILLMETQPGFWTLEMANGSTEEEVPIAILTPIRPNIAILAWVFFCNTLRSIFYREVEEDTPKGTVTRQEFDSRVVAATLLGAVILSLLTFIANGPFYH